MRIAETISRYKVLSMITIAVGVVMIALTIFILSMNFMPDTLVIYDELNDTNTIPLFSGKHIPYTREFHDIAAISVSKDIDAINLILRVKGGLDSIKEYDHETVYIWELEYTDASDQNSRYFVVLPYFPEGYIKGYDGWYIALYDANSSRWLLPLMNVEDRYIVSGDEVRISIPNDVIDTRVMKNPSFRVFTMVNVDTKEHPMPDYMIDSLPDGMYDDRLPSSIVIYR
jgi:hypothetical protein